MNNEQLSAFLAQQNVPLLFVTISGAHLYGFPSPDSDYDLRGMHLALLREVLGLDEVNPTINMTRWQEQTEIDFTSHEVGKYFELLLKKSGNLLEQVYSPLVLVTTPEHEALQKIVRTCLTRHFVHHYLGMTRNQWELFEKEQPRRVKPLLYVYRALLTGLHLMRTHEVEANLVHLHELYALPYLPDLIARKLGGAEHSTLEEADIEFHRREYLRLRAELELAFQESTLPENPAGKTALNDLLLEIRLNQFRQL